MTSTKVTMNCKQCGKEFIDKSRSQTAIYCSRKCCKKVSDKKYHEKNKFLLNKKNREYHQRRENEFIFTYKKRKSCVLCGYKEHPDILQFHHKDRKTKSFEITLSKLAKKTPEELKKELDKCILICPNCHFLLHLRDVEGKDD